MRAACLVSMVLVVGCDGGAMMGATDAAMPGDAAVGLRVLGSGTHSASSVDVVEIVTAADHLRGPSDVAFNPSQDHELWVTERGADGVAIVFHAGAADQRVEHRTSSGATHFLASPSGLAFDDSGTLATIHDIDTQTQGADGTPADFMGPTLWPADATLFDGGHDSHLDMLHDSPSGAGIAWDTGNAFWVYDGFHHAIAHYDFRMPHEPGGTDHMDGVIQRWVAGDVGYFPHVASHMELDHATGLLYVADTRNARVVVLDTTTGVVGSMIGPDYDGGPMMAMDSAPLTILIDGAIAGLDEPSGLALRGGVLYITDHARDTIHAYDLRGNEIDWIDLSSALSPASIGGIELDVEGRIYVTDTTQGRIVRVAPRM